MNSDIILFIVVAAALVFGFTNGFHDTFDVISTAVSTGAAPPQVAIVVAALLNFAGAFLSIAVATTVARDVVDATAITPTVVFAGLIGAIAWNLATWWLGLPSSSSHALIGGMVGATVAAVGTGAVAVGGLVDKVLLPALVAPIVAFLVAGVLIAFAYKLFGGRRPGPVTRGFRVAQVASGGLLALAHGANDAQKTMGVITLALIANGTLGAAAGPPSWAIVAAAAAIALGTYSGGWRILRTTGARIIKMDAAQGFSAQSAGAAAILVSTYLGFPISTTHAINGGVMGAGAAKRVSAVRWGVAGNIVVAWLLTLPAAAAIGAAVYGVTRIFGTGALGPVLVTLMAISLAASVFGRRLRPSAA
ncbi:MAG TPA: inorganic phosphate transporter [Solirubrobacterales bacterium]|jgi:PiT family inorganic phosphate transporter|nr:inorganic phosphate transporter [Solirubrobacterales bacterium]